MVIRENLFAFCTEYKLLPKLPQLPQFAQLPNFLSPPFEEGLGGSPLQFANKPPPNPATPHH
jgi:hypothetical protein